MRLKLTRKIRRKKPLVVLGGKLIDPAQLGPAVLAADVPHHVTACQHDAVLGGPLHVRVRMDSLSLISKDKSSIIFVAEKKRHEFLTEKVNQLEKVLLDML